MMDRETNHRETDSVDLVTAFAIGAMIGVGATLLLRPDEPTRTERIMERLSPMAKRARKAGRRAGRQYGKSLEHSRAGVRELGDGGKDILDDFRAQVEDILSSAREELGDSARQQLKSARKALGRRLRV